jgi:hypothetical protein
MYLVLCGRGDRCTGLWLEKVRKRDHLVDPGVDGKIILRRIFRYWDKGV